MCNEQFQMGGEEVEHLFKVVAKCQRTIGVTLSTTKLTDKVYRALDAIVVERMRAAVAKASVSLADMVAKHDGNRDGFLEYKEIENMFLELQLAFRAKTFDRLCGQLLDAGKKAGKVHGNRLKFLLQSEANIQVVHASQTVSKAGKSSSISFDEPSKDKSHAGHLEDVSEEELALCRTGARKVLQAF